MTFPPLGRRAIGPDRNPWRARVATILLVFAPLTGTLGWAGPAVSAPVLPAPVVPAPVVPAPTVVPPADRLAAALEPTYRVPVNPTSLLRGFDATARRYGPGHRGVDLRAPPGAAVTSAAAGTVTFAGQVAGRGVVVVTHPDGIRTTYEPVAPRVPPGERVRAGQLIASVAGRHDGCAESCLHWGARRGPDYLDPLDLLRPLGPVRLVPTTGPPATPQARGCACSNVRRSRSTETWV